MRRRWVALLPAVLWCAAAVCPAAEPDGALVLRAAWIEGTSRLLVTVDPRVEILDAVLIPTAPAAARLRAVREGVDAGPDGRLALGVLRPGGARILEFEARRDLPEPAVAGFRVEGRTADGRPVAEAVGHVLSAGPPPRPRDGAIEFPARAVPEEGR